MWQIAIVSADESSAQNMANRVSALFTLVSGALSCAVTRCSSAREIGECDIAILSGAEARRLREAGGRCEIILTLKDDEDARQYLDARPIGAVSGRWSDDELKRALAAFFIYHGTDSEFFTVENRQALVRIRHREILYFESKGKIVYPRLASGPAEGFPARLDVVENRLARHGYKRCHKSYLVNVSAIIELDKRERQLTLVNGARVPVSKKHYPEILRLISERRDGE